MKNTRQFLLNDGAAIEAAVGRLQEMVKEKTGSKLNYGAFKIVMHEGNFTSVEFELRDKIYCNGKGRSR